jgi:hypothetical protein
MKKPFLKRMMGPMAVIILGSIGAFGTMSMSSSPSSLTDQVGYRFVNVLNPCEESIMCSTIINDACTTENSETLWGKYNEHDAECPKILYKK